MEAADSYRQIAGQTGGTVVYERPISEKCGCFQLRWTIKNGELITVVQRRIVVDDDCPKGHKSRPKLMLDKCTH